MSSLAETFAAARRHHQDGQLAQAEALCRRILDATPDHPGALHLLGVLAHQQGRHDQAIEHLGRAVALDPTRPAYRNNLGVALRAAGRLAEAGDAYRAAARLAPASADAHANLGVALHELGRSDEARARYEEALRLRPDHVDALFNLANLLHQRGHSEQALPLYRRAQTLAPDRADILNNLGNALLAREQADEAIAAYRAALALNPDHAEAWANLGTALGQQDRIAEAAEAFAAAARLRPQDEHWPIRSAALCPTVFPSSEALDAYRKGLEAVLDAHPAGVRLRPEDAAASGCHPPFNLAHHGRNDRDLKARFAAAFLANFPARHASVSTAGMPRVGFVATDPRRGMFLRCTAGIIDHLDPGQFDVVVFGPERGGDALRAAIARPDARIVTIPDRLPGAAECIAAERCDVLYHWQIGSDALNYFLPFTRPAPIQCTSWGTHVTSGVPAVDYYLSSALIEPPGAEAHYTETLVPFSTLPTYQRPIRRPDPPARRSEFGLPEGVPLYACLQRLQKFHPDFDPLLAWMPTEGKPANKSA